MSRILVPFVCLLAFIPSTVQPQDTLTTQDTVLQQQEANHLQGPSVSAATENGGQEKPRSWLQRQIEQNLWAALAFVFTVVAAVSTALIKFRNRSLALRAKELQVENEQYGRQLDIAVNEASSLKAEIQRLQESLSISSSEPTSWSPPRQPEGKMLDCWRNEAVYPLTVPSDRPYLVTFSVEAAHATNQNLWRAGIVFYGKDILDPQLLFHFGWQPGYVWTYGYTEYPLIRSGTDIGGKTIEQRSATVQETLRMQVLVEQNHVTLRAGSRAWRYNEDLLRLSPSELRNPHLVAWSDNGICDISFWDIRAEVATQVHREYLTELVEATRRIPRIRDTGIREEDFKESISGLFVPRTGSLAQTHERGLELIPHNLVNGKLEKDRWLTNVPLLERFSGFTNGEITFKVWLSKNSIFDLLFRGSLVDGDFYLARLDTRRTSPTYNDRILHKERDKHEWATVHTENRYDEHTPAEQWIDATLILDGSLATLRRGNTEVYQAPVPARPGSIGLIAELNTVWVRGVRIQPY